MPITAGSTYNAEFVTSNPTTGAAQNADSLPVATANHNGTDDATFTLTVTNLDTGRYKVSGTVPSGYAAGDSVWITVAATVATIAGKAVIDSFPIAVANSNVFAIDTSGRVTSGSVTGNVAGSVASVTGAVGSVIAPIAIDGTKPLGAPRALDAVADGSITWNDVGWAAVCNAAGKEDTSTYPNWVIQTPSTGTTIRTFTLTYGTPSPAPPAGNPIKRS
jgi:hypothetical protein